MKIRQEVKLSKFLMDYGISTYLLNMKEKDPSELGFTKFWELLNSTQQSTFSDIIKEDYMDRILYSIRWDINTIKITNDKSFKIL